MDMFDEGSGERPNEGVSSETFHIYLLSFAYGSLITLVLAHMVWRWQWRRTELSHLKPHYPGDKSFHCKGMRKCLKADFSVMQRLHASPKARLVNPKYSPNQFGTSSDGSSIPSHWYRMKVFDAAADFVSQNVFLVEDRQSDVPSQELSTLFLPAFISLLRESGVLDTAVDSGDSCCELYKWARYRDGVFTQTQCEEFQSLLTQLRAQLHGGQREQVNIGSWSKAGGFEDPETIGSPSSEIVMGYGLHDPLQQTTSYDPLIRSSSGVLQSPPLQISESTKVPPGTASASVTPYRLRGKNPTSIEMSPLVKDSDSLDSLAIATPHSGPETAV